jgi:hypothetical protein
MHIGESDGVPSSARETRARIQHGARRPGGSAAIMAARARRRVTALQHHFHRQLGVDVALNGRTTAHRDECLRHRKSSAARNQRAHGCAKPRRTEPRFAAPRMRLRSPPFAQATSPSAGARSSSTCFLGRTRSAPSHVASRNNQVDAPSTRGDVARLHARARDASHGTASRIARRIHGLRALVARPAHCTHTARGEDARTNAIVGRGALAARGPALRGLLRLSSAHDRRLRRPIHESKCRRDGG